MLGTLILSLAISQNPILVEDFNSVGGLVDNGWTLRNNSNPGNNIYPTWFRGPLVGPEYWFTHPRFSPVFDAHEGDHYLGANFRCCGGFSGQGTLSLWAVTPTMNLANKTATFWVRRTSEPFFPDRLQVRWGQGNADPGNTPDGVGDFTVNLLDLQELPSEWTQYSVSFTSARVFARTGRLAFRYYSENAGPDGLATDYIGIDTLRIQ